MPWMKVSVIDDESEVTRQHTTDKPVENAINTDTIVRFGPWIIKGVKAVNIKFVDGSSIYVSDSMEEIIQVVLKADEKKK